ncbi:HPF/RaiA family ribosome-associated protein [Pigmentibacter ruber]
MQVEVHFVNFPKSQHVKELVAQRIQDCVTKFSANTNNVRAYFSVDGIVHHVKLALNAGKNNICVNAFANDVAHSVDKALDKLESALRKISKRKIHKRIEFSSVDSSSDYNVINLRKYKRYAGIQENIFDKFETHYVSNFEDQVRKEKIVKNKSKKKSPTSHKGRIRKAS